MIVVAIIGILAAVALPAYQDYTIRARVTEGLSLGSGLKATIGENIANEAAINANACNGTNLNVAGQVSALACASGVVTVTMTAKAGAASMTLTPTMAAPGDPIAWSCLGTPTKYVPAECR
jgi:type IV pilus assembly protein PilA